MEKLDWVPLYVYRLIESDAWNLPDYQFGWYMKLLIKMVTSSNPGYLHNDIDELWRVAGARTKAYFQREGQSVLDRYFKRTADMRWIYNEKMLETVLLQTKKLTRPPSSISLSIGGISDSSQNTNQEFNSAEASRLVLDEMNLSGPKMHRTAQGSIERAMAKTGLNAQLAAEFIVMQWQKYQKADIRYKVGKTKFLEECQWDETQWRRTDGDKPDRLSVFD